MNPRLIVMWLSILVVGCQSPVQPLAPLDPTDTRPDALMTGLANSSAARASLTGALRLSLDAPDLRFRRPQRLALRRPADLRVEILGLFGQIAAVLVTNGVTYQSFSASGGFESGDVTPDLLWRVARVDLEPGEAVDVLLGVPLPSAGSALGGAYSDGRGSIRLDFRDAKGRLRERFDFDPDGHLADFARFNAKEQLEWEASFDDYRDVSGSDFAFEINLSFPDVDATASLQFDHASLGPELADELFVLPERNGAALQ